MREPTVARNYAEVLVSLAQEAKDLDGFGAGMDMVADACAGDARLKQFMETPRVTAKEKATIVAKAFDGKLPAKLVRFVEAVIRNRRQHLLSEIAIEYHGIVDALSGRAHAQVQVVSEPSDAEREVDREGAVADHGAHRGAALLGAAAHPGRRDRAHGRHRDGRFAGEAAGVAAHAHAGDGGAVARAARCPVS